MIEGRESNEKRGNNNKRYIKNMWLFIRPVFQLAVDF